MKEDFKCNVLIMGKTGTGKSTLLNYLCDSDVAQTGSGKPVTGEGIYEYSVRINGQEVRIFDSWGIEAGKVERWRTLIGQSLQEHGVQQRMEDWFHSVIYCIQAGGGRVEDIDSEIIRKFLSEGYLLTVVLTKADQVDEDDEAKMKNVILNELNGFIPVSFSSKIKVVATCAEKKKIRSGETKPFGKEELQKAILDGWKETVIERIPKHVVASICKIVDDWCKDEIARLPNLDVSGLSEENKHIYDSIIEDSKTICEEINEKHIKTILTEAIDSCKKAGAALHSMLNYQIEYEYLDENEAPEENFSWWIWPLAAINIPIIIPALIIEKIKSKSTKRIREERQHIEDFIKKSADDIKSKCAQSESNISKIVRNIFD